VREYTVLISADDLHANLGNPGWVIVDCRFVLADPSAGERDYREGHIPGAVYAQMDRDLSGPIVPGKTGRHPLPSISAIGEKLGAWGIDASTQVVVYDASGGAMAGRLWWLLRWLGHDRVAVLDGGWTAWIAAGHPVSTVAERPSPKRFLPRPHPEMAVDAEAVEAARSDPRWRVIDARAADRFRGKNETIDPVAGHIPGAVSAPYADNLGPDGRFRTPGELRARYAAVIGDTPAERVVCYCGSGITSVHNVLAIAHAGLGLARLYPGSWSEWITDPERPIARLSDAD
jgi:thiosulfate/3-mercaptopyruvate sulfurtransferase